MLYFWDGAGRQFYVRSDAQNCPAMALPLDLKLKNIYLTDDVIKSLNQTAAIFTGNETTLQQQPETEKKKDDKHILGDT
jgi:hypothetical protein